MLQNQPESCENSWSAETLSASSAPLTTPLLKGAIGMAVPDLSKFDLSTREGRYRARKAGFDVPKQKPGYKALDFWSRTKIVGECLEWTGPKVYRYGVLTVHGRTLRAHRHAYSLTYGPIPAGLVVMHICDNPSCVKVDHLRLGTNLDNSRDAMAKGRVAHGERNSNTRLKLSDVAIIRDKHRRGQKSGEWTTAWISQHYGLEKSTVRKIVSRKNWRYA